MYDVLWCDGCCGVANSECAGPDRYALHVSNHRVHAKSPRRCVDPGSCGYGSALRRWCRRHVVTVAMPVVFAMQAGLCATSPSTVSTTPRRCVGTASRHVTAACSCCAAIPLHVVCPCDRQRRSNCRGCCVCVCVCVLVLQRRVDCCCLRAAACRVSSRQ
jgi:hypothetical protein